MEKIKQTSAFRVLQEKASARLLVILCTILLMGICISSNGKLSAHKYHATSRLSPQSQVPAALLESKSTDRVKATNLNVVQNPYGGYNVIADEGEVGYNLLDQLAQKGQEVTAARL